MNRYIALVLLVAGSQLFAADTLPKPPWEWTSEERIAARFEPQAMRDRLQRANLSKAPADAYVIEGKHNSELFFAWELLDSFLRVFDVPPSRTDLTRASFRPAIEARGWNFDSFWREVERATEPYRITTKQIVEHRRQVAESRRKNRLPVRGGITDYLVNDVCRERAIALRKLRASLGRENFDAFLYTNVAPSTTLWITHERDAALLVKLERGCQ